MIIVPTSVSQPISSSLKCALRPSKASLLAPLSAIFLGKALAVTKELGVHYWEAYPDHMATTTDPAKIRAIKEETEGAGVQVIGYVPPK